MMKKAKVEFWRTDTMTLDTHCNFRPAMVGRSKADRKKDRGTSIYSSESLRPNELVSCCINGMEKGVRDVGRKKW